jgi:hypothetical protein
MLGIMVLSVVYDQEFEPVITFAFDAEDSFRPEMMTVSRLPLRPDLAVATRICDQRGE